MDTKLIHINQKLGWFRQLGSDGEIWLNSNKENLFLFGLESKNSYEALNGTHYADFSARKGKAVP